MWEGVVVLFGKGLVQQPGDDGQVATLIVRRQNDRVLVSVSRLGRHCEVV